MLCHSLSHLPVFLNPRDDLPVQLIKLINDPTESSEVIYTFYRCKGEVTWTKRPKLLKYCQINTVNM